MGAQPENMYLAAQLFMNEQSIDFNNTEAITNVTNIVTKDRIKFEDTLKIAIIDFNPDLDQLISDIVDAVYSHMPTCGAIVKGFGLILLGEGWSSVSTMFSTIKLLVNLKINTFKFDIRKDIIKHNSLLEQLEKEKDSLFSILDSKRSSKDVEAN